METFVEKIRVVNGGQLYYMGPYKGPAPERIELPGFAGDFTLKDGQYVDKDGMEWSTESIILGWFGLKFRDLDDDLSETQLWDLFKRFKQELRRL